ncbi:MAG: hypothetical protein IPM79_22005 [Polyangiaceae bacterium]|jgi:Cys-rich repeat protein|nr:hypothetical protein [Polyangiaceae bacterium]MBK8940219.1 hypothetical protein [Polyangiaceae bacterium]
MTTHVPPLGARAPKPRLAAVLAALCLVAGALLGATSGCSSTARFPVCQTDDDCKDKGDSKLCYDLRCVQCRYDADCGEGRFCERKVAECKSLDGPRAGSAAPSASASAEPATEPGN